MKNSWIKILTGASAAGMLMISSASYADEEAVLVVPDKGDATSLKLSGRMHFQAGYVDQSNDVNSGDWSTMEVRRARVGAKGKFANNISAAVEANVKPSDVSVSAATLTWGHSDALEVTVGFDKPMVSLEENTSSASILTVERSNVNNNIAAGYDSTGIWAAGEVAPFFYHVGLYNGEDVESSRNTSNEEAEYMFNARGGIELALAEDVDVMAMVSYLESDDPNGALGFDDMAVLSLHVEAGAFDLRTEYFMGTEGDEDTTGFYIMPSVMLSDALEVVARYEMGESDSGSGIRAQSRYARRTDIVNIGTEVDEDGEESDIIADKGDEFSAIYLGLNYYHQKYNKFMLGVEFSELENTDAGTLESTTVFSAYRVRF